MRTGIVSTSNSIEVMNGGSIKCSLVSQIIPLIATYIICLCSYYNLYYYLLKGGVPVAYWLKCWPAIERLQVQSPLGGAVDFFSPMSILSSILKMRRCSLPILWRGKGHHFSLTADRLQEKKKQLSFNYTSISK